MSGLKAWKNARLIDPAAGSDERGALLTSGDRIVGTVTNGEIPVGAETTDCRGKILMPGLVDMRSHQVDRAAALAGGVTTLILQPNQTNIIDTDAPVERIRTRSDKAGGVVVHPMGAATKGMQGKEIAELGQMLESGAVAFTDCERPVSNAQVMRRLMTYAKNFDALIVQFAQDLDLAGNGYAHEGEVSDRLGLAGIPVAAEVIQIERDARLAELTGARLHIPLVSSRDGVLAIKAAKDRGIKITCGTAPHYLHLNENTLEGYRTFGKVSPPLRSEEDRVALIEGVADGTIDIICSDHKGCSEDTKRLPMAQAEAGIASLETMLSLVLSLVHSKKIDMMAAMQAMTSTPASILGLDCGSLAKGARADLIILDPGTPWAIHESVLQGKYKNTPFETIPVQGRVYETIVGGKSLYKIS